MSDNTLKMKSYDERLKIARGEGMKSPQFNLPAHKVTPEWRGHEIRNEISSGSPSITRLKQFIEAGAWLEVKDAEGNTPLLLAVKNKNTDAALLLINSGADLTARDKDGYTPFYHAANTHNLDILRPLLAMNAPEGFHTSSLIGMDRWDDYVWSLKEEIAKIDAASRIRIMKKLTLKP